MAENSAKQLPISSPRLPDIFTMFEEKLRQTFHCFKIGVIQSYDAAKRTVQVQVVFRRQMWDDTITDFPVLYDCPVLTLQGGGIGAAFPIAAGDECVLLFADNDIDAWYQNGGLSVPNSNRRHDISDPVALVGLNSLTRPLPLALTSTEGGIADSTVKVAVKNGKVNISNGTQDFKTMMDTFTTGLTGATLVAKAATLQTSIDLLFY